MFGIEQHLVSWELQLVVSVVIALVAVLLFWAIRQVRGVLQPRMRPVLVDVLTSTGVIVIIIATVLLIAETWGQTTVLLEQLGFLRLDARAPQMAVTLVILIAIYVLSGVSRRLLDDLVYESNTLTEHQREVGARISQLSLWGIGLLVILGVWEIDLTGLLVGAGFLGIVVGLASRKTLGSLIAGLMLMLSRPFEVGEWILVGDQSGIVTEITLMSTRVRSPDGERVVIPNDVVTGEILVNRSREGRLRAEVDVGIDYDDDIGTAIEIARETAEAVVESQPHALESPEPSVLVRTFEDSSVVLRVRIWIEDPSSGRINDTRHELRIRLKEALKDAGLTIPFPQREVSARGETDDLLASGIRTEELDRT